MNAATTILDGTVAILWGAASGELSWVHLSAKHGRVSIANARRSGFWVRDTYGDAPNIEGVAAEAYAAWSQLRDGEDGNAWATHRLVAPAMRAIERIPS